MKAPDFWYQDSGFLAWALTPIGFFYRHIGRILRAHTKPARAKKPIICVGNITAGGTGKTPSAMAIAKLLISRGDKPAFVLRGYGGNNRTAKQVTRLDTAKSVGDEAMILSKIAPTFIGRNRLHAIRLAEKKSTHIIMDDGLQNRHIKPDCAILVIDGTRGFGNGKIIPAGPLRETLMDALPRIDAVLMIGGDRFHISQFIPKPIFYAEWRAGQPKTLSKRVGYLAFAGIGNPQKFYATCRDAGLKLIATQDFPDHHLFSASELANLISRAREVEAGLVTTEKDWVRLPKDLQSKIQKLPATLVFKNALGFKKFIYDFSAKTLR